SAAIGHHDRPEDPGAAAQPPARTAVPGSVSSGSSSPGSVAGSSVSSGSGGSIAGSSTSGGLSGSSGSAGSSGAGGLIGSAGSSGSSGSGSTTSAPAGSGSSALHTGGRPREWTRVTKAASIARVAVSPPQKRRVPQPEVMPASASRSCASSKGRPSASSK